MNVKKHKIVLYGPKLGITNAFYGGGTGGYTRNMEVYLNEFDSDEFKLIPCFHTIRLKSGFKNNKVYRLLVDMMVFVASIFKNSPVAVHILAQYRGAIMREYMIVRIARFMGKKVLYEVKAGAFIKWHQECGSISRFLIKKIISRTSVVLVEGQPYLSYMEDHFGKKAYLFPNFVPNSEMVEAPQESKYQYVNTLQIMFVGFCYEKKGVFDLVNACIQASKMNINIELSLIGNEAPDFSDWMNALSIPDNLKIKRIGQIPHQTVLENFQKNSVYCFPTKHPGEGHNNSINEAMMNGMCILCTAHGFLPYIIKDKHNGLIINPENPVEDMANGLRYLHENPNEIKRLGLQAYDDLKVNYTTDVLFPKLIAHYKTFL